MIRLRPSGVDELLIKRVRDWYEPGPGVFFTGIAGTAPFTPAALFTTGVNGAWYDPSDMTTLYQDAAGTTPVTAMEQPVGLILDKSKGLVLGSELVVNGTDFVDSNSDGTPDSWVAQGTSTMSVVSGVFRITTAITNGTNGAKQLITGLTAGKTYKVSALIRAAAAVSGQIGSVRWANGDVTSGYSILLTAPHSNTSFVSLSGYITPSGASVSLFLINGGTPDSQSTFEYDNISVKEIAGNHAFNNSGNSANFPVLSARYNLYVNTETLATQNVTTAAVNYKLTFTGTGSITLSGTATGTYSAGSYTITCTAGTLTSTVSGTVTQADIRPANESIGQPAYQRVGNVSVTASDYDTVGFKPYLRFNDPARGTNNWLQTGSIDFTSTDKMFVCAGTRKNNSTVSVMAELSQAADSATYPGSFYFVSSEANVGATSWGLRGTAFARGITASVSTPVTEVNSAKLDLAGAGRPYEIFPRINGTDVSYSGPGTDAGTGNYGNYPLYIGARAGSSLWFNGRIYGLIICGKQASASEITNTETYLNQKTGAY